MTLSVSRLKERAEACGLSCIRLDVCLSAVFVICNLTLGFMDILSALNPFPTAVTPVTQSQSLRSCELHYGPEPRLQTKPAAVCGPPETALHLQCRILSGARCKSTAIPSNSTIRLP